MFDAKMYAECDKWVRQTVYCPDLIAVAIVLAWYRWSTDQERPLRQHCYYAARQVADGRDLPGVQNRTNGEMFSLTKVNGGAMTELADSKPGPTDIAEWVEQYERFWDSLSPRETRIAEAYLDRVKGMDIAKRFKISPGRAAQIRRDLMRHLE